MRIAASCQCKNKKRSRKDLMATKKRKRDLTAAAASREENLWGDNPDEILWEPAINLWEEEEDMAHDYDSMGREEAESELCEFLLQQFCAGKMSATQTSSIAWLATRAGLKKMEGMAVKPDSNSGNFSRKMQNYLSKDLKGHIYEVPIPAYIRHSGGRCMLNLSMVCPHEVLYEQTRERDLAQDIALWEKEAPPAYFSHPILEKATMPTLAYALFLDGVQYSESDSLVAITMTNLVHNKKVLLGVVRKRLMCGNKCNCACGTWCSMFPIYQFLAWSMTALAE
eukprot:3016775-Amphidinium_carterae.1